MAEAIDKLVSSAHAMENVATNAGVRTTAISNLGPRKSGDRHKNLANRNAVLISSPTSSTDIVPNGPSGKSMRMGNAIAATNSQNTNLEGQLETIVLETTVEFIVVVMLRQLQHPQ